MKKRESIECAKAAFLDAWANEDWTGGVQVDSLSDLQRLVIVTQNSVYEVTIISAHSGEVLVRGGRFFPDYAEATLAGSSLGGSFIKFRGVYIGFRLEFIGVQRTIITSPVRSITVLQSTGSLCGWIV